MDLKSIERFVGEDIQVKITKISGKRPNPYVIPGMYEQGSLEIVEVLGKPAVLVSGRGFDYIRTSPIVNILEETDTSVTLETEGGVYKVEKL